MKTALRVAATLLTITALASCADNTDTDTDPTEEDVTTDTNEEADESED